MKYLAVILSFVLLMVAPAWSSSETEQLLKELEQCILDKDGYQTRKQERINTLVMSLQTVSGNQDLLGETYEKLYAEYRSFIYDSAFKYVNRVNELADESGDLKRINKARIMMGFTLLSSGLFKESLDILNSIRPGHSDTTTLSEYYAVIARTYYDLADYDNDDHYARVYRKTGNQYLDSALNLLHDKSPEYWSVLGLRKMKSNDLKGSADAFNYLISNYKLPDHELAIATSSLGYVYSLLGRTNEAIDMLMQAAIADIKSSTKETVALRNLAVHLFNKGDITRAYQYIKIAFDDATFYNARHRKIEIGAVLPIIEGERLSATERQKKQLMRYSVLITILSILLITFALIIYKQLKELKKVKRKLQDINADLQEINDSLEEANKIKEKYIGYFFKVNSIYIEKIEEFQKVIHRKIVARQFDDLDDLIKNSYFKKERENLYTNFDKIFLKIFPHFVNEFNVLFKEEDRIILQEDELLNTDLRIFALMRLGISDNEQIAKFLDYSVNTIYTYKTKVKSKALVSRHEFDERIMAIRAI
jgi:tetratricopeptide (TPR) repeat protein